MHSGPEISVVIAAYKQEKFIEKAIRSILDQSFQDFEIIVVDDGSPDYTGDVVASIHDKRITYHYQKNSGLPASARNTGMAMAKGKYIALLDGDDYWHKEKLEKCKKVLDEMKDVGLVCHNEALVYDGKILRYTSNGPYEDNMYQRLLLKGNCLHSSAVVLRREIFFDDNCRFMEDKDLFTIEDYEYWMRLAKRYRFYFLPDVLAYVNLSESGAFLSNGESNTGYMLRLLDLNFEKIEPKTKSLRTMMRKRKSSVMCAAGRMQHHKSNFIDAKRWYLKAISEYPWDYKPYIGFMAAFAKLRIIYF